MGLEHGAVVYCRAIHDRPISAVAAKQIEISLKVLILAIWSGQGVLLTNLVVVVGQLYQLLIYQSCKATSKVK